MRWFDRQHHHYVTLAMRTLQLASSALALGFVAASFQGHDVVIFADESKTKRLAITMHYGGPTVNFALVVTYSAAIYSLLWIAFVYIQTAVRVPPQYSIGLDAIFTVMLLSAGCAVAASDYVRYCGALAQSVHCSTLQAGASFCFIAFVAFLISVAWGAWIVREQLSESHAKAQGRRQQQQLQQVDELECSPSTQASNSYHETTFVC